MMGGCRRGNWGWVATNRGYTCHLRHFCNIAWLFLHIQKGYIVKTNSIMDYQFRHDLHHKNIVEVQTGLCSQRRWPVLEKVD